MSAADIPIKLTSKAITPNAENYYTYDQQAVLFTHEPIRREMERGIKSLESLNLKDYPWKIKYFQVWLLQFFIPVVTDHHDSEEIHMGPFYVKRGVTIPEEVGGTHKILIEELNKISQLTEKLVEENSEEALSELKIKFKAMCDLMVDHFADEEKFWPDAIKSIGEEEFKVFHKEMHTDMKARPAGHLFFMSALDAMGYDFDGFNHIDGETKWCSNQLLDDMIINKIPYFVRSWIFTPLNRKYQYYKMLIHIVQNGTEDNMPLKYEEASMCIIS